MNLTTKHKAGNALTLRDTRRAFKRFRKLKWFRDKVKGGVAAFEISQTTKRNGIHVHVHCIIDCKWLSVTTTQPPYHASAEQKAKRYEQCRKELNEQWSLATGRRGEVWVKREADVEKLCKEQLKYNVKGSDLAQKKKVKGPVAPIIRSMTGVRMIVGFGSFYRHPSIKRTKPVPKACSCGCQDWMLEKTVDSVVRKIKKRR